MYAKCTHGGWNLAVSGSSVKRSWKRSSISLRIRHTVSSSAVNLFGSVEFCRFTLLLSCCCCCCSKRVSDVYTLHWAALLCSPALNCHCCRWTAESCVSVSPAITTVSAPLQRGVMACVALVVYIQYSNCHNSHCAVDRQHTCTSLHCMASLRYPASDSQPPR